MKPQDLQSPFLWEERRPWLADNVLHIPKHYFLHEEFSMPSWEELFGNTNPVFCELCSGNGDWVVEQARSRPEVNWIAVEKRFDRVRKIWSKMHNFHVSNLRIVRGEAETFFRYYVQDQSLQKIVVNFPDPWPKMRHRKHRLFQEPFMKDVVRVLIPSGNLILVSDDLQYVENAINVMQEQLSAEIPFPHYKRVEENYGSSWFENLWRSKGLEIFYTEFKKD